MPNAQPEVPLLSSIQDFLFGAPLYAERDVFSAPAMLDAMFIQNLVLDGHCPHCHRTSTFQRSDGDMRSTDARVQVALWPFTITCVRDRSHTIHFAFRLDKPLIQKIGQYPSLADIANDKSRIYRQVLKKMMP
jgi:hypothetical protein